MMSGRIVQNNPQRHFADEPQGLVVSSKLHGNSDAQGNALECSRQPVRTAEHLRGCKGEVASCVCGSNPGLQVSPPVLARDLPQHGRPQFHDEVGHDLGPSHVWRRATNSMDSSGPAPSDRRAGGEQGDRDPDGQEGWHGLAKGNHGAEQDEPQKVRLDPPCADQPPAVGPTIPGIQKAAMEKLLTEIPGEDGDLMGYGKFSNRTYLDVKENEPKYCEWTKAISKEESTSTYMKRFVDYLMQPEETEKKRSPIKVNTVKDTAKKGYKTEVVKREEGSAPLPTSTASSSTEATVNQLTQLAGTLIAEVKELKEEPSTAVPRKIAATSDVKMGTSHKDSR